MKLRRTMQATLVASCFLLPVGVHSTPLLRIPQMWAAAAGKNSTASRSHTNVTSISLADIGSTGSASLNCWEPCERRSGFCGWCGGGKACCRAGVIDAAPECQDAGVTQQEYHECVVPTFLLKESSRGLKFEVEHAEYGAQTDSRKNKDVTEIVNELVAMHGVTDFTGHTDFNKVFGDPAPKMRKRLRLSRAHRWMDLDEFAQQHDLSPIFAPEAQHKDPPSMYVAVMSRRAAFARRTLVRDMWMRARGGSDRMTAVFAICNGTDIHSSAINHESKTHGDVLLLDCAEGYGGGALTIKNLLAMKEFKVAKPRRKLFMKVDDDSFIAWKRYSRFLRQRAHENAYIGVPISVGIPCRNSSFKWYEPYSTFNGTYFPEAMAGGPGYLLGRSLVQKILDWGIGWSNVLWNEDRATGVWISKLKEMGVPVEFVGISGIDGWWKWDWQHPMKNWETWADYPHMVHHGLHGESISCLAQADDADDPWRAISQCFTAEVGVTHEALTCFQQTQQLLQLSEHSHNH